MRISFLFLLAVSLSFRATRAHAADEGALGNLREAANVLNRAQDAGASPERIATTASEGQQALEGARQANGVGAVSGRKANASAELRGSAPAQSHPRRAERLRMQAGKASTGLVLLLGGMMSFAVAGTNELNTTPAGWGFFLLGFAFLAGAIVSFLRR